MSAAGGRHKITVNMAVKRLSLLSATGASQAGKETTRSPKRQKTCNDADNEKTSMDVDAFHMSSLSAALNFPAKTGTSQPSASSSDGYFPKDLPTTYSSVSADSWAQIMDYLPFRSGILALSSTSKFFQKDVSKLLQKLVVTDARDMHRLGPLGRCRRFAGIREIDMECLIQIGPVGGTRQLCPQTASKLVEFLSNFAALERAWVGGVDPNTAIRYGYKAHYSICRGQYSQVTAISRVSRVRIKASDEEQKNMRRLIMSVCDGYNNGKLPSGLILRGVMDWESSTWASTFRCESLRLPCPGSFCATTCSYECGLCESVCRSFPLEHVLQLKCGLDDSNLSNYSIAAARSACPSFSKRLSIVASRPGGVQAIRKLALTTAFARQRASMSICVPVDEDSLPSEGMTYGMLCPAIHFRDTMRWDDVEAALHYIDASEIGYYKLIRWIQPPSSVPGAGSAGDRSKVLITKSAFSKLKQLGFYLQATDFRAVIDNGNDMEE